MLDQFEVTQDRLETIDMRLAELDQQGIAMRARVKEIIDDLAASAPTITSLKQPDQSSRKRYLPQSG